MHLKKIIIIIVAIIYASIIIYFIVPYTIVKLIVGDPNKTFAYKCFGDCTYSLTEANHDCYLLAGPDGIGTDHIIKYKEIKSKNLVYLIGQSQSDASRKYFILNYESGKIEEFSSLNEMAIKDLTIFEKEESFVDLLS